MPLTNAEFGGTAVIAPVGTPPELMERAVALIVAGEKLGMSEEEVRATASFREVSLRIRWWMFGLTERTARIIVEATTP